jgi:uncharacterized protein (DUF2126 family)
MILGQELHIETKAPPRELILENAAMPPDPGMVPVQVSSLPTAYITHFYGLTVHNICDILCLQYCD